MGRFKSAMSYLGIADVAEDEDYDAQDDFDEGTSSEDVDTRHQSASSRPAHPQTFNRAPLSRITTIHPKNYNDAQAVGRAVRDGVPVVLNLSDVSEAVAYRIVDFSAGVVFGLRGSIERVTPRVFLLSPAQVSISIEDSTPASANHDLFSD
jgi:cell division inhibitor SepF